MNITLENETVVITGGARRLGRAIAQECARSGGNVCITYNRSEDDARQTLALLELARTHERQQFAAIRCDVTGSGEIERLKTEALALFPSITALVNSAAIFRRTPFEETDSSQWEQAFDDHIATNLKAPYVLSHSFGKLFIQQKRGSIVNIADIYGTKPLKNYASYCTSKAGVVMLTEVMARALAPHVRVNCICPGTILVPSEAQGEGDDVEELLPKIPAGRLGTPEEIAQSVVFLIGGPQFITGAILHVDGAQRLK